MEIRVHRAGTATTVQDLGRPGARALGVPPGGAMDPFALRVANLLVGNPPGAAGLEIAGVGPELEFLADALIAVAGAEFAGLESRQPHRVERGGRCELGKARHGFYGYLAISGGLEVPEVLGGRGTYLRGSFGGFQGRVLRRGDVLQAGPGRRPRDFRWWLDPALQPSRPPGGGTLRVIAGANAAEFSPEFYNGQFVVSPRSDRVGLRLTGRSLVRNASGELLSQPVTPGTLQVPADGHPILLMADAPTVGGYPQLGTVCAVDRSRAAQLRTGDRVSFAPISLEAAEEAWFQRERALGFLAEGLALHYA